MGGRLRVGAAVGTGQGTDERVDALVKAGVDVIVVDTAHGHTSNANGTGVIDRVRWVKERYPDVQVIGGNIATAEAAIALAEEIGKKKTSLRANLERSKNDT